jgi:hypothetical protein
MLASLVVLASCGRIDFNSRPMQDGDPNTSPDALGPPPAAHVTPTTVVDAAGDAITANEADGTHMVFVDSTPGEAGDLVIFREGSDAATLLVDTSSDNGATWTERSLTPPNTVGINALGACQDTVGHAFHVSWCDTTNADQYTRLVPTYSAGHITGFTIAATFAMFDDYADSPSPRDLAEIIDGDGTHRLLFTGAATAGSNGRYKLAVTSPSVGVLPASQNDWTKATDQTALGSDDALLPNNYTTNDTDDTYMVSVSSNRAAGSSAALLVLAGFPADRKLLAWTLMPMAGGNFTLGAEQTLTTSFGGGTGLRTDASLSLVDAPSGTTWFAFSEDATASAPGIHVASLSPGGQLVIDAAPQPSTSVSTRHAVIGADNASVVNVFYADGSGNIDATLLWGPAWVPAVQVATMPTPVAAWALGDAWQPDGVNTFGMYCDSGSTKKTTFSMIGWQ